MRLRLLPVLAIAAGVALTARVGELWQGLGNHARAAAAQSPAESAAGGASRAGSAATQGQSGAPQAPELDPLTMSDEEVDLLQALANRRLELDERSRQLEQREALLQAAEQRIEEKVDGLKALQKSIEDLLLAHEQQTETQYESLVKIYENMKPKDAARIFEELDMAVLLPVVERMKERKTAPILANMNPEKAKAITVELAQRRNLPTASR